MTDATKTIRAMTEQTLDAQKRVSDWQLEQLKNATKAMTSGIESSQTAMATAIDMQQKMAHAFLDAVAPKADDAKA